MPRFLHPLTDLLEMLPHEDDALRPSADELFRLARILDERGMTKEADRITDSMVRTAAYEGAGWGGTGQYQMTPQAQPQGGYGMQQGYGGGYAQPQQNPLNDPIGRSISYMNAVKAAQQAQQSNNPEAYQQAYQRAAQAWGMMGEGEQAGMAKNYETGGSQAGNAAQAGSWQVAQPQAYKGINGQMQQPSPFEVARAQAWQAYYNGDQEGYQQAYQQAQQAFSSMPRGQQQAYWQTQANWRPQVSFQAANQPQQTPNQQTRSLITPQGTSQVPQPQQARSLITPQGTSQIPTQTANQPAKAGSPVLGNKSASGRRRMKKLAQTYPMGMQTMPGYYGQPIAVDWQNNPAGYVGQPTPVNPGGVVQSGSLVPGYGWGGGENAFNRGGTPSFSMGSQEGDFYGMLGAWQPPPSAGTRQLPGGRFTFTPATEGPTAAQARNMVENFTPDPGLRGAIWTGLNTDQGRNMPEVMRAYQEGATNISPYGAPGGGGAAWRGGTSQDLQGQDYYHPGTWGPANSLLSGPATSTGRLQSQIPAKYDSFSGTLGNTPQLTSGQQPMPPASGMPGVTTVGKLPPPEQAAQKTYRTTGGYTIGPTNDKTNLKTY